MGQACTLSADIASTISDGGTDAGVDADYLESGNTECDSLICIMSPSATKTGNNPYCSKPCVSDDDCYTSETGLVCRAVTVDATYLANVSSDIQEEYCILLNCGTGCDILSCAQNSYYCAVPL